MGSYAYPGSGVHAARPHAPVSVGGVAFSHDANGNLTGDGTRSFSYDAENRLVKAVKGAVTVETAYGPDGSRARKVVTDKGGPVGRPRDDDLVCGGRGARPGGLGADPASGRDAGRTRSTWRTRGPARRRAFWPMAWE